MGKVYLQQAWKSINVIITFKEATGRPKGFGPLRLNSFNRFSLKTRLLVTTQYSLDQGTVSLVSSWNNHKPVVLLMGLDQTAGTWWKFYVDLILTNSQCIESTELFNY